MRIVVLTLLAGAASLWTGVAQAGAGVSPFIAVVDPGNLGPSWHAKYNFSRVDVVYVMSVADARSVSWTGYVWGPHGTPLIGSVPTSLAADELRAVTDPSLLASRAVVAIADDSLLQGLVDSALVGPCGHEPSIEGTVEAALLSTSVQSALRGVSMREAAVGVGVWGLRTWPITRVSSRTTGSVGVAIINPDSMYTGGWCGANPKPLSLRGWGG